MCQSAVSAFLRCRFVRELGAAKRAVPPDVPHQTARSSAEAYQFRGWKMRCRHCGCRMLPICRAAIHAGSAGWLHRAAGLLG